MKQQFSELSFLKKVWVVIWQILVMWLGMTIIHILIFPISFSLMNMQVDHVFLAILIQFGIIALFGLNIFLYAIFATWYAQITITGKWFFITTPVVMMILVTRVVSRSVTIGLLSSLLGGPTGYSVFFYTSSFVYLIVGLIMFLKTGLDVYKKM